MHRYSAISVAEVPEIPPLETSKGRPRRKLDEALLSEIELCLAGIYMDPKEREGPSPALLEAGCAERPRLSPASNGKVGQPRSQVRRGLPESDQAGHYSLEKKTIRSSDREFCPLLHLPRDWLTLPLAQRASTSRHYLLMKNVTGLRSTIRQ